MIFGLIERVPLQLLRVGDIPLQLLIFEICYSYTSFNTLGPPAGYVSLLPFRMDRIALLLYVAHSILYVVSIALSAATGGDLAAVCPLPRGCRVCRRAQGSAAPAAQGTAAGRRAVPPLLRRPEPRLPQGSAARL